MRSGCRRGSNLRRVCAARIRADSLSFGNGAVLPPAWKLRFPSLGGRETQRTPCPVPGRNKPGPRGAEKTVEVVRNHVDGTGRCGLAAMARRLVARRRELVRGVGECAGSEPPRASRRRGLRRIESEGDRTMRGLLVRVRADHGLRVVPLHDGRAEREVKAGRRMLARKRAGMHRSEHPGVAPETGNDRRGAAKAYEP